MRQFNNVARDNTYNSENSFSAVFTWTVWTRDDDTSDWCWNREPAYVAICRHRGGDVRGNYGPVSLHRVDDSLGDCGFLDWVLGWDVATCPHLAEATSTKYLDTDDLDDDTAQWIVDESQRDDRLSEEASPGYHSYPATALYNLADSDSCYWCNGAAILRRDDGEGWIVARPYHYSDCELTIPKNGSGYICDAMIDTDSFIDNVLGEDILEALGERQSSKIDSWLESVEWDYDDVVAKLCGADDVLQYCD